MLTVWLLFIWAQCALCSLPANLDTLQFIPGDPAPSFTAYLQQEPPLSFNAWATQPSADLPLLLFAADPSDPFGHYMSLNNQSIDSFLQSGPSGVQTILSSWDQTHLSAMRAAVLGRLALASPSVQKQWSGWLHFTNSSMSDPLNSALAAVLQQWSTPRNMLRCGKDRSIPRLDCHYAWCGWPSQDAAFELTDAGVACSSAKPLTNLTGTVLVRANGCSVEAAAREVAAAGASYAIVVQSEGLLAPAGVHDSASSPIGVSVISASSANYCMGSNHSIESSFETVAGRGQWMAVDHKKALAEVGWEKYSTMQMLSWESQWLEYRAKLATQLSLPSYVLPVMSQTPARTVVNITMPPLAVLSQFSEMQLDFGLSCAGNMNRDCSVWDRIATVTADCGDGSFELGRWINAFQRREGRWLSQAPLLPLLYPANSSGQCQMSAAVAGDDWLIHLNLRFSSVSNGTLGLGLPQSAVPVVFPNMNEGFDSAAYNVNRTMAFKAAEHQSVAVVAIITGHSGCEFIPTSHHFMVNGHEFSTLEPQYSDRFMQAGSALGCANKTSRGAVPNEHGTWYFGRNGWCDGEDVKELTWDVSAALSSGGTNELQYKAYSYEVGGSVPSEAGCNGNIKDVELPIVLLMQRCTS